MARPTGRTASTQKMLSKLEDEFNCEICWQPYDTGERRPKVLPCSHTLCLSCIKENNRHGNQRCSYCRKINRVEIDELPDNLKMLKFLDIFNQMYSRQEFDESNATCESCPRGIAANWCYHCRKQICEVCTETHEQMNLFTGHIVKSLEEINLFEANKVFYCEKHRSQELDKFCNGKFCEEPICAQCINNHKGKSHNVVDLQNVHKQNVKKLEHLLDRVLDTQPGIEKQLYNVRKKKTLLDTNVKACNENMRSYIDCKRKELEQQEKRLKRDSDAFKFGSIDQYNEDEAEAESYIEHIRRSYETYLPVLVRQNPVEVAKALGKNKTSLENLSLMMESSLQNERNTMYSFLKFLPRQAEPTFIAFNVCPANTKVEATKTNFLGETCKLKIILCNKKNEQCLHQSEDIKMEVSVLNPDDGNPVPCVVYPEDNGEYLAEFTANSCGEHDVIVSVMGDSVLADSTDVYCKQTPINIFLRVLCMYTITTLCFYLSGSNIDGGFPVGWLRNFFYILYLTDDDSRVKLTVCKIFSVIICAILLHLVHFRLTVLDMDMLPFLYTYVKVFTISISTVSILSFIVIYLKAHFNENNGVCSECVSIINLVIPDVILYVLTYFFLDAFFLISHQSNVQFFLVVSAFLYYTSPENKS